MYPITFHAMVHVKELNWNNNTYALFFFYDNDYYYT